jgi:HSP20 family protein
MADKDVEIKKDDDVKEAENKRSQTESMLTDIVNTIREKQEDLGKTLSDYTVSLQKPLADIMESDEAITVITDLPGVKKGDVEVNITEDTLDIVAKFDEEVTDEGTNYIKKERSYGETRRSIALPDKVDVKNASAEFKDSVLTIKLPKIQEEKHKVDID